MNIFTGGLSAHLLTVGLFQDEMKMLLSAQQYNRWKGIELEHVIDVDFTKMILALVLAEN